MPTKRMLIDAAHPEETRVAIVENGRLVDYDVEVASRRQIKGNIYLAKVIRVEPSLQAAFVDYGGNRHGFLAFNEIHPDYYQIPVADREALLAEQTAAEAAARAEEEREDGGAPGNGGDEDEVETPRPQLSTRRYKIQEVIKRRQIMLVQAAKEERGSKGAALTTYLSLAGRYCVLMPNTTRGGGISRKITNAGDRKRLKQITADLGMPDGMAVILRTAGAERSKSEIRRDYEYLIRLWNNIRELTLTSTAPAAVYEEASLLKRSIRDLYERTIDEILIEGEASYRAAKDFMKLFIPSHAKRVKLYEDHTRPLLQHFGVESELEAMLLPTVQLKSGGSIVINPTEALVSIDVNSGRSTRERHIEETALRTNLEACDEIARQLRLRDLAGLIVVDFIDMENARNQAQVERRLKEAVKADRARIQLGRISPFGLLEMSRQRLRPSLFETSFETCRWCSGTGRRRNVESMALAVLRRIDEAGFEGAGTVSAGLPEAAAFYLLNNKRKQLVALEERYGIDIQIAGDDTLPPPGFRVDRIGTAAARPEEEKEEAATAEPSPRTAEAEASPRTAEAEPPAATADEGARRGRRRRPRRRRRDEAEAPIAAETEGAAAEDEADAEAEGETENEAEPAAEQAEPSVGADDAEKSERRRRRRGRRGGRRRAKRPGEDAIAAETSATAIAAAADETAEVAPWEPADDTAVEALGENDVVVEDTEATAVTAAAELAGEEPAERSVSDDGDDAAPVPTTKRPSRRRTAARPRRSSRAATAVEPEPAAGEAAEARVLAGEDAIPDVSLADRADSEPVEPQSPASDSAEANGPDAETTDREPTAPEWTGAETVAPRAAEPTPPEQAPASSDAAAATSIDDDGGLVTDDDVGGEERRRGWWQRLIS
jgi:ribonuclease E